MISIPEVFPSPASPGSSSGLESTVSNGVTVLHDGSGSSDPSASISAGSCTLTLNSNKIVSVEFVGTSSGSSTFVLNHNSGVTPNVEVWNDSTGTQAIVSSNRGSANQLTVTGLNASADYRFKFAF